MENYDFKKYKESLILCDHIPAILKIINLTIKGLSHFKVYTPVAKILSVTEEQKRVLESHYEKNKEIKKTKGKIR